jgi:plasmid stabilization system protein ParE
VSRTLRTLGRARADIDRIYVWLRRRSPQGGATWYDALYEAVGRIAERAESYPQVFEAGPRWNRDIRQALFKTKRGGRYRIVFELTDAEIRLLRVRGPGQPPLRKRDLPSV